MEVGGESQCVQRVTGESSGCFHAAEGKSGLQVLREKAGEASGFLIMEELRIFHGKDFVTLPRGMENHRTILSRLYF